jgi:hypothetical protein
MKQRRLLFLLVLLLTATTGAWAQSTTHVVNQDNVNTIFSGDGYTLGDAVSAGDILDFQGTIDLGEETSHSLVINKQVNIISSTKDAVIKLHTVAGSLMGADPGNSFIINKAGSGTTVQDIRIENTETWFYNTSNVTFTGVTMWVEEAKVGAGVGAVSIRFSDHMTFDGCTFYTKNNGGSAALTVNATNNCTFKNCSFEGEGNIGNLLYLGNIFNLNDKPENFGDYLQCTDCSVLNCSFTRSGTSAAMLLLGGLRHRVEGVTSENLTISSSFGADTPTSADDGHIYRNNTYKGNMTVLKYSTAENNTLTGSMTVQQGATATGNTITGNVTVQQDATATGNTITGNVTVQQDATATGNKVEGKVTASSKNATIQGNTIISTEEYAVYLTSTAADANNTVTNNDLKAAAKTGDEAVSSKSTSNTIKDNGDANKYTAKLKEDVQDADKWTIAPAEATTDGVYRNTKVTLQYNGRLKVKGVKATSDAAPAAPALIVNPEVGQIIGSDGKNYAANATLPDGVTAVAMIAYVGSETGVDGYTHGLALALTDEGQMAWEAAMTACNTTKNTNTPVTGATWLLASQDQWKKMIDACKNVLGTNNNSQDLRDGFSGISGASNLQSDKYWSSTEYTAAANSARVILFSYGMWGYTDKGEGNTLVRACLAF